MNYKEPSHELDAVAHRVIGAAIEVHKELGPGFLESTYEAALAIEMGIQKISFSRQHPIGLKYKGHILGEGRLDLLVENQLIVELKAVEKFHPVHHA